MVTYEIFHCETTRGNTASYIFKTGGETRLSEVPNDLCQKNLNSIRSSLSRVDPLPFMKLKKKIPINESSRYSRSQLGKKIARRESSMDLFFIEPCILFVKTNCACFLCEVDYLILPFPPSPYSQRASHDPLNIISFRISII